MMMAVEGPFLAAVIARLADPKENLAAHGVSFAIAIIIEAPVIMLMSTSTALARDRDSFLKLWRFTFALNTGITLVMVVLLFTPGMDAITRDLIGLPDHVADLVWTALVILLPWPAAIGYRRFYQGVLIQGGQTRQVAYGTIVRVSTMAVTSLLLFFASELPGAYVGAAALSAGVTLEAVVARIMAINVRRRLLGEEGRGEVGAARITYREIIKFYYPLALTSTIALAVHPMVTFFVGQSRLALDSLAVIPVVNSLVFLFRAPGLSFLEAAIALMGDRFEHYRELRNFAAVLGCFFCLVLGLIAFTPFSYVWFEDISGLTPELADFAILPTILLVAFPILSVLLSLQRAILVKAQRTPPITWSTVIEMLGVIAVLSIAIQGLDMIGAIAASIAVLVGRFLGLLYLVLPCRWVMMK
jgi:hypothetical protein